MISSQPQQRTRKLELQHLHTFSVSRSFTPEFGALTTFVPVCSAIIVLLPLISSMNGGLVKNVRQTAIDWYRFSGFTTCLFCVYGCWINAATWYLWMRQEFVYVGDEGVVEPNGQSRR